MKQYILMCYREWILSRI